MKKNFCFRFYDTKKEIKLGDIVYIDDGDESGIVIELGYPYSVTAFDNAMPKGGITIKTINIHLGIACPRDLKFLQKDPNNGYFFKTLRKIKVGDTVFYGKKRDSAIVTQIYPAYSSEAYKMKKEKTGEIFLKVGNDIFSRPLITTIFYEEKI